MLVPVATIITVRASKGIIMLSLRYLSPFALMIVALGCSASGSSTGGEDGGADSASDADVRLDQGQDVNSEGGDTGGDVTPDVSDDVPDEPDTHADSQPDATEDSGEDGSQGDADQDGETEGGEPDAWWELGTGVWITPGRPSAGETVRVKYEGKLASSSQVTMRFGFDGWNDVGAPGATSKDDGTSNTDFFHEVVLTREGTAHVGQIDVPAKARAIHSVFWAKQSGQDVWDNNGMRDYNLGIRFPYIGPFLTWLPKRAPSEHVEVHFHTGVSCEAFVQYGTETLSHTQSAGSGQMHHVVLEGLTPSTRYQYRVGCKGLSPSETFSFQTAPPDDSTSIDFAFASDAQDNGETGRWGEIATAIRAYTPAVSMLVFSGDLPWNDKPGLWWTFFDRGHELLAGVAIAAVPGNHDTPTVNSNEDTSSFRWFFGLDGSSERELTRDLRWGPARFVLLSTETPNDFLISGGRQYEWAKQTLSTTSAPWVFVSMHIPPYNMGARHWGQQGTFRDITALFDGAVDWVLTGHEHLYQRSRPMRYNGVIAPSGKYARGSEDGVGYIVNPPAGAWPESAVIAPDDPKAYYRDRFVYPAVAPNEAKVSSEQGFGVISLRDRKITLRVYGIGTPSEHVPVHVLDEVTYDRQ